MFKYFSGWKRKTGLVTLALSCLFAAGWARSVSTYDAFALPFDFGVATWNSGHMVGRIQEMPVRPIIYGQEDPPATGWPLILTAAGTFEFVRPVIVIPYRWIAPPLTLFSAWLLLSKRHQPIKPEPYPEPAP